jgi:hypothetical protein
MVPLPMQLLFITAITPDAVGTTVGEPTGVVKTRLIACIDAVEFDRP